MSSHSAKGYKFTIANGTVTAVYEVTQGKTKLEHMDSNEVWSLNGNQIVKTEFDDGVQKIKVYADVDGDGIYNQIAKTSGLSASGSPQQAGYKFETSNDGQVTAVYQVAGGVLQAEHLHANESWAVEDANFVRTEFEHGMNEVSVYSDPDGDGIYVKSSKTYLSADGTLWSGKAGGDADDQWRGTGSADTYYAAQGNDQLAGSLGDDDLYGGDGDDRLQGDSGADDLYGGNGADQLYGGVGDDRLLGAAENDRLEGGAGHDDLYGEDGDDVIAGGLGSDDLYGGAGLDIFKFFSAADTGLTTATCDHIHDFTAEDRIDLSVIDAVAGTRVNDAFKFIGNAASLTATNANGALWFDNGYLYGSTDRDSAAEFAIELLGVSELLSSNLVL